MPRVKYLTAKEFIAGSSGKDSCFFIEFPNIRWTKVTDKLFQQEQGEEVYVICLIQFIPGASSINHKVVMISA